MPPSNPTVDLAAACLIVLSIPVSIVAGWSAYKLLRTGLPPSRVPDLGIPLNEVSVFLLSMALLVLAAGPLVYPASVILTIAFLLLCKTDLRQLWNFERNDLRTSPGLAVTVYLAALPLVGLLLLLSLAVGSHFGWPMESQKPVQMFLQARSPMVIAGIILLACVLAPVAEELLFRGFLYPWLKGRIGRTPALALTSLAFGLAHLHWSSFLSLAFFGLVLNLVYDQTGKLAHSMALHATFNLVTCGMLLLYKFSTPGGIIGP
ncbi:MAG: CPBP family intramembrane glutamic endopeptidase [Candidatus Methylacidiphilales bacterium]|nr:CPBP family intramembrane glutamic endopeptidase [Candidatus Methylacidiphilales bacterium]